jgi:hypothetical protein
LLKKGRDRSVHAEDCSHRTRTFKLSSDPFFIEKVRDIVGLYLNPLDHALVLCVDEKSLDSSAPSN